MATEENRDYNNKTVGHFPLRSAILPYMDYSSSWHAFGDLVRPQRTYIPHHTRPRDGSKPHISDLESRATIIAAQMVVLFPEDLKLPL